MRDADEEVREIKKEIIESRGLIIKTSNLVNSLAADIKSIGKRQAGYERRFTLNSVVAYVLFATLTFVGVMLFANANVQRIESEQTELRRRAVELEEELEQETSRAERRTRAEGEAARYYDLIRERKRAEVVSGYDRIRKAGVTRAELALFRDTVDRFRADLSMAAYQQGLDLVRTGRYAEASEKFQEAIDRDDTGSHIPAAKYQLARSLRRLGRQGEAMVLAQGVIDQTVDRELHDDATWLLSRCAEDLDQIDDARVALRTLIRRWPRSSLAPGARRHLGELNLRALRGSRNPD